MNEEDKIHDLHAEVEIEATSAVLSKELDKCDIDGNIFVALVLYQHSLLTLIRFTLHIAWVLNI